MCNALNDFTWNSEIYLQSRRTGQYQEVWVMILISRLRSDVVRVSLFLYLSPNCHKRTWSSSAWVASRTWEGPWPYLWRVWAKLQIHVLDFVEELWLAEDLLYTSDWIYQSFADFHWVSFTTINITIFENFAFGDGNYNSCVVLEETRLCRTFTSFGAKQLGEKNEKAGKKPNPKLMLW